MFLIPSFEAVDKTAVEGNAMAAACGCADEVIVVNIATDSQGDAWYNRQKDNVALTTAAENKPAAYIGVTRTDVGVADDEGKSSRQKPITGVLLYQSDDTTAPAVYVYFKTDDFAAATGANFSGGTLVLVGGAGVVLGAGVTVLVMIIKKKKDSAKA